MAEELSLAQPRAAAAPPDSGQNPWLVLTVLCMGVFMLILDSTVVNVAQQSIIEGLGANLSQIQWVFDAYILIYAVLLLSGGRMGDVFGRKRLFVIGMVIFTLASGLCGVSGWLGDQVGVSGINALIAFRVLQGFGGALMMPQSLALLMVVFPPAKRGAAFGVWGSIVALGAVVGPIIGGYLVSSYSWEWVFLINVPVGIVTVLASRIVPEATDPQASRNLDPVGVLLSGAGIFALVYALIEGNSHGWTSNLILGLFVASVVLLALFVWWELRAADPMMKIELFRFRNFSIGNILGLIVSFGMLGIFFPLTLFLQATLGYSALKAGLVTIPNGIAIMLVAPFVGRMLDRVGPRWFLTAGLALTTVGVFLMTYEISLDTTWKSLVLPLTISGAGLGMVFPAMTAAAMQEVPVRVSGSASGILNTTRNIGQVLGIAVLGAVLQNRIGSHAADHLEKVALTPGLRDQIGDLASQSQFLLIPKLVPASMRDELPQIMGAVEQAFVDALHNTFIVGALSLLLGALCALMIRNRVSAPATSSQAAAEVEPVGAVAD